MHLFAAARCITLAAALLGAAAAQSASPAPAPGLQKVRIGTLKMAALTDVWVAKQAGIFAKNGLDAELVEFRSGNDAIQYMNADAARAKENVAAYTGLNVAFLKDMPLNRWSYEIDPAKWQGVADMMHGSGELQKQHKVGEYLSDVVAPYVVK